MEEEDLKQCGQGLDEGLEGLVRVAPATLLGGHTDNGLGQRTQGGEGGERVLKTELLEPLAHHGKDCGW